MTHRLLPWLALAGALVVLTPGLVHAQGGPEPSASRKQSARALIAKGQDHFDEQRYEESVQVLSAALMRPGTDKPERIQIYKLLAYNYIVLRRDEEADGAVRGLLVIEPEFRLPETESPRFRDFFAKIRQDWEAEGRPGLVKAGDITPKAPPPVKIDHLSPAQVEADLAIVLDGNVEDPGAVVAKITLYYRAGSSGTFQTAPVTYSTRRFRVEIPAATVQPPLIEYYLEAVDDKGLPRANRGDATAPLRIAVPDEGGSVLTSPWFWVPTGLVVVGAAVAIAVVVATTGDGEPPTSTVSVNVFE